MSGEPETTGWHLIGNAPAAVRDIARRAQPPLVGQFNCKLYPLPDAEGWVVLKFAGSADHVESYIVLPAPPL